MHHLGLEKEIQAAVVGEEVEQPLECLYEGYLDGKSGKFVDVETKSADTMYEKCGCMVIFWKLQNNNKDILYLFKHCISLCKISYLLSFPLCK